jgi:hypothetical protein
MSQNLDSWAEQAGLGRYRGTFRPAERAKWKDWKLRDKIGTVVLLGGAVITVVAATAANVLAGVGVIAGILGFGWLIGYGVKAQARANVGRELRFYERGVAVVGTGGTTLVPYRWADMTVLQNITRHYRNGVYTHTSHVYTLSGPGVETSQVKGGTANTFEQPEVWGAEIQQQVTEAQLPPALATVRAGLALQFGPFTVNAERLSAGEKSVAWSEVQELKTEKGFLSVKQQGRWFNMAAKAVSRIPNFFVFRTLADQLLAESRSPQQYWGPGH